MADEQTKPPYDKDIRFPRLKDIEGNEIEDGLICDWTTLSNLRGAELEAFYGSKPIAVQRLRRAA